jgi:hypothetical protein
MHNNNHYFLLNNAFFVWFAFWFEYWLWRFLQADGSWLAGTGGCAEESFWLKAAFVQRSHAV